MTAISVYPVCLAECNPLQVVGDFVALGRKAVTAKLEEANAEFLSAWQASFAPVEVTLSSLLNACVSFTRTGIQQAITGAQERPEHSGIQLSAGAASESGATPSEPWLGAAPKPVHLKSRRRAS